MRSQKFNLNMLNRFRISMLNILNYKNVIQNVSNLQSTFLENNWNNFDNRSSIYAEQIKNQVDIFTENFVKACEIWNQIAFEFN